MAAFLSGPPIIATYSLRRRLVGLLVGAIALIWLATGIITFREISHEADELFDAQLVQLGDMLMDIVADDEAEHVIQELQEHTHRYHLPIFYQIWRLEDRGNRLLLRSPNAPQEAPVAGDGFFHAHDSGNGWRIYARSDSARDYRVIVAQKDATRGDLAARLGEHLVFYIAWSFPPMALAIWWLVTRALKPVQLAADAVSAMEVSRLTPLPSPQPRPVEIAPLIDAIDTLTARVATAMEVERRFTADAAHELRTPLAALRIQAQVAARASDPAARDHALAQVVSGVTRMTRLVEQLLTLARLDPAGKVPQIESLDLAAVLAEVCAELAPQALTRHQELRLEGPDSLPAVHNRAWLEVLVRNLVDNGLRYGQENGTVAVRLCSTGTTAELEVADDGPGVPPDERKRLHERFYRGESATGEGNGLGLSIVARIVSLWGGTLEFGDGLPRPDGGCGLAVRVRLPLQV